MCDISLIVDWKNSHIMPNFEGKSQKIVPITIVQLENILSTIKQLSLLGKSFRHENMQNLYERCTDVKNINNSTNWLEYISNELCAWENQLLA